MGKRTILHDRSLWEIFRLEAPNLLVPRDTHKICVCSFSCGEMSQYADCGRATCEWDGKYIIRKKIEQLNDLAKSEILTTCTHVHNTRHQLRNDLSILAKNHYEMRAPHIRIVFPRQLHADEYFTGAQHSYDSGSGFWSQAASLLHTGTVQDLDSLLESLSFLGESILRLVEVGQ